MKPLMMLNPLTHETFDDFVRSHRHVVIHFWGPWNASDQLMKRLLETEIPAVLREQVAFASFDVDPPAHHAICRDHKVLNVPFLAFYRDGLLILSITGMQQAGIITERLRSLISTQTSQR
jgi:thioredoxin-like negative regulator of GroEL